MSRQLEQDEEREDGWSDDVILRERGYSEEYITARRERQLRRLLATTD